MALKQMKKSPIVLNLFRRNIGKKAKRKTNWSLGVIRKPKRSKLAGDREKEVSPEPPGDESIASVSPAPSDVPSDPIRDLPSGLKTSEDASEPVNDIPLEVKTSADASEPIKDIPLEVKTSAGASEPIKDIPLEVKTSADASGAILDLPSEVKTSADTSEPIKDLPLEVKTSADESEPIKDIPSEVKTSTDASEPMGDRPLEVKTSTDASEPMRGLPSEVKTITDASEPMGGLPSEVKTSADASEPMGGLPSEVKTSADTSEQMGGLHSEVKTSANTSEQMGGLHSEVKTSADTSEQMGGLHSVVKTSADDVELLTAVSTIENELCSAEEETTDAIEAENSKHIEIVKEEMVMEKEYRVDNIADEVMTKNLKSELESEALVAKFPDEAISEDKNLVDVNYVFEDDPDFKYDCKLCAYHGKMIIYHYKNVHPTHEIYISRLKLEDAQNAIAESDENQFVQESEYLTRKRDPSNPFTCRICFFRATKPVLFYEHCSSHTGEYRFKCNTCSGTVLNRASFSSHCQYHHKNSKKKVTCTILGAGPIAKAAFVFGFLCSTCNFVQLTKSTVERHIASHHRLDPDARVVRINMSKPSDNKWLRKARRRSSNARIEDEPVEEGDEDYVMTNGPEANSPIVVWTPTTERLAKPSTSKEVDLRVFVEPEDLKEKEIENEKMIQERRLKVMQEIAESFKNSNPNFLKPDKNSITDVISSKLSQVTNFSSQETCVDSKSVVVVENKDRDTKETVQSTTVIDSNLALQAVSAVKEPHTLDQTERDDSASPLDKCEPDSSNSSGSETPPFEEEADEIIDHLGPKKSSNIMDNIIQRLQSTLVNKPIREPTPPPLCVGPFEVQRCPTTNVFTCNIDDCSYSSTHPSHFVSHVETRHSASYWDGVCGVCVSAPGAPPDERPVSTALLHLLRVHLIAPATAPPDPAPQPLKTYIRMRRLSGDKLSVAKETDDSPEDDFPLIRIESVVSLKPEAAEEPETAGGGHLPLAEPLADEMAKPPSPPHPMDLTTDEVFVDVAPLAKRRKLELTAPVLSMRHKQGFDPSFARDLKKSRVYDEMLTHRKLRHLYKCMDGSCAFTTNVKKKFEAHIIEHEKPTYVIIPGKKKKRKRLTGDWQRCPYCSQVFGGRTVSIHIDREHGNCLYQCAYCFHRAMSPSYIFLHQNLSHVEENILILLCIKSAGLNEPAVEPIPRGQLVLPFICRQGDCNEVFYILEDFEEHLLQSHSSLFIYTCNICENQTFNPKRLIGHYRLHNINAYQCVYCLTGTLSRDEMHHHLCNCHSNRPPIIVVRELDQGGAGAARTGTRPWDRLRTIDLERAESVDPRLILAPGEGDAVEEGEGAVPSPTDTNNEDEDDEDEDPEEDQLVMDEDTPPGASAPGEGVLPPPGVSAPEGDLPLLGEGVLPPAGEGVLLTPGKGVLPPPGKGILLPLGEGVPAPDVINVDSSSSDDDDPAPGDETTTPINVAPPPGEAEEAPAAPSSLDSSLDSQAGDGVLTIELPPDSDPGDLIAALGPPPPPPGVQTRAGAMPQSLAPSPFKYGAISPAELQKTGLSGEELYRCGYSGCSYPAADLTTLRDHLMVCDFSRNSQALKCFHCNKNLKHLTGFVDHISSHSTARYGCGLCPFRSTGPRQVTNHLRQRHRVVATVCVPLDPTEWNSQTALFVVGPKEKNGRRGGGPGSRKTVKKKHVYQPHEVNLLPRTPIYQHMVSCGMCSFTTKVRINMVRHLNFHDSGVSAPTKCPINPVPCLEKNEMMFDKMTNLAASSHAGPRPEPMGGQSLTDQELSALPQFVPEKQRFVCGAVGCSYASCDESMLLHHVHALHRDETGLICPHCSEAVPVGRLSVHLKMHDARLYRCGHCPHHHHQRHLVERHLAERHGDRRPLVHTVREPPPRGPWLCNLCPYDCSTRAEVLAHTSSAHGIKSQFKCGQCTYRSSSRHNLETHAASKHPGCPPAIVDVYSRARGAEPPVFDTTPIWRRDMLGVRHIRGILLEEEQLKPEELRAIERQERFAPLGRPLPNSLFSCTVCNAYSTKFRADMRDHLFRELKYAKFQCAHCDKKTCNRNYLQKHIPRAHFTEQTPSSIVPLPVDKDIEEWVEQLLTTQAGLMKTVDSEAGVTGKPSSGGKTISHTAQQSAKSSAPASKQASPSKPAPSKPAPSKPSPSKPLSCKPAPSKPAPSKAAPSKAALSKAVPSKAAPSKPAPSKPAPIPSKPASPPSPVSPTEADEEIDVTGAWSWDDVVTATTLPPIIVDAGPDSDPEVSILAEEPAVIVLTDSDCASPAKKKKRVLIKKFPCSHCGDKFATIRGLKCHIKLNHLAMGRWRCSMCKGTHNSEIFMKSHCASKHPEATTNQYFPNPNADIILSDEWWADHYNISQLEKDHKLASTSGESSLTINKLPSTSVESTRTVPASAEKPSHSDQSAPAAEEPFMKRCVHCNFKSKSASEFRRHEMRHWIQKPYRCGYCDFNAIREFEVKQHSAKIHPFKEPLVLRVAVPLNPDIRPIKTKRKPDSPGQDSAVASLPTAETESDPTTDGEHLKFYKCHYCPFRGDTMETTYEHWQSLHQHKVFLANGGTKSGTGLVFKCNEINFQDKTGDTRQMHVTCGYCKKKGSHALLTIHQQESHPGRPFLVTHSPVSKHECGACEFQSNTSATMKKHWAHRHPGQPLQFTVTQEKPSSQEELPEDMQYACVYCDHRADSAGSMTAHLADYHSHLERRYEVKTAPPLGYKCPLCAYASPEQRYVREHLKRHARPLQCGHCVATFDFVCNLRAHSLATHPGLEVEWKPLADIEEEYRGLVAQIGRVVVDGGRAVARKSTTPRPGPRRQVALKSTVPLPRPPHWPEEFSFYGREPPAENFARLKTVVQIGPSSISISVESMLKGINMAPALVVRDIRHLSPSSLRELIASDTSY